MDPMDELDRMDVMDKGAAGTGGTLPRVPPLSWIAVPIASLLLLAYPACYAYHHGPERAAIKFFAVDTFYYLGVAARSVGAPFYTFDGAHPTNGFHPLWQYLLTGLFGGAGIADDPAAMIRTTFLLSVALVAAGTTLAAMATLRLSGRPALALFVSAPGPFHLALLPLFGMGPHYGASWSYMNGMESGLSILFVGAMLALFAWRDPFAPGVPWSRPLALSLLATAATLSRLDDVFLFFPILIAGALACSRLEREGRRGAALGRMAVLVLPPLVGVGAYLIYNLSYCDMAMPVSAAAKTRSALGPNLLSVARTFAPFDLLGGEPVFYVDGAWRALQTILPFVAGVAALIPLARRVRERSTRRGDGREAEDASGAAPAKESRAALAAEAFESLSTAERAMLVLGTGYAIKCAYTFANIDFLHQGHWYAAGAVLVFNVAVALALGRLLDRLAPSPRAARLGLAAVALGLLYFAVAFGTFKRIDRYQDDLHRIWTLGPSLRERLRENYDGAGFVEFDDGVLSWSLGIPALSGLGFTLDREAFEAKERGELLEVAWRRGFRVFVSYQYYLRGFPESMHGDGEALRTALRGYWGFNNLGPGAAEDLSRWNFRVVDFDRRANLLFIGFEPRTNGVGERSAD